MQREEGVDKPVVQSSFSICCRVQGLTLAQLVLRRRALSPPPPPARLSLDWACWSWWPPPSPTDSMLPSGTALQQRRQRSGREAERRRGSVEKCRVGDESAGFAEADGAAEAATFGGSGAAHGNSRKGGSRACGTAGGHLDRIIDVQAIGPDANSSGATQSSVYGCRRDDALERELWQRDSGQLRLPARPHVGAIVGPLMCGASAMLIRRYIYGVLAAIIGDATAPYGARQAKIQRRSTASHFQHQHQQNCYNCPVSHSVHGSRQIRSTRSNAVCEPQVLFLALQGQLALRVILEASLGSLRLLAYHLSSSRAQTRWP